jgi:hypothetical protein
MEVYACDPMPPVVLFALVLAPAALLFGLAVCVAFLLGRLEARLWAWSRGLPQAAACAWPRRAR